MRSMCWTTSMANGPTLIQSCLSCTQSLSNCGWKWSESLWGRNGVIIPTARVPPMLHRHAMIWVAWKLISSLNSVRDPLDMARHKIIRGLVDVTSVWSSSLRWVKKSLKRRKRSEYRDLLASSSKKDLEMRQVTKTNAETSPLLARCIMHQNQSCSSVGLLTKTAATMTAFLAQVTVDSEERGNIEASWTAHFFHEELKQPLCERIRNAIY